MLLIFRYLLIPFKSLVPEKASLRSETCVDANFRGHGLFFRGAYSEDQRNRRAIFSFAAESFDGGAALALKYASEPRKLPRRLLIVRVFPSPPYQRERP